MKISLLGLICSMPMSSAKKPNLSLQRNARIGHAFVREWLTSDVWAKNGMKAFRIAIVVGLLALITALIALWPFAPKVKSPQEKVVQSSSPKKLESKAIPAPAVLKPISQVVRPPHVDPVVPPEPLSGYGQTAPLVRAKAWKHVGRETVGAAIQSQFWAIAHGDVDYLKRSTVLDESATRSLASLLEQVSASVREQYSTPESLAAFLLASRPALKGYALSLQKIETPNETSVSVMTLLPDADRFELERQEFRRDANGEWYRVIGSRELSYWHNMIKWDKELSKSRKWTLP